MLGQVQYHETGIYESSSILGLTHGHPKITKATKFLTVPTPTNLAQHTPCLEKKWISSYSSAEKGFCAHSAESAWMPILSTQSSSQNLLSYSVSKINVHVHLWWPIISAGPHSISMDSPLLLCCYMFTKRSHRKATFKTAGQCIPTTFIVILATKISNKHKNFRCKNHWSLDQSQLKKKLHPNLIPITSTCPDRLGVLFQLSNAPTSFGERFFFFSGLVIHLGLCGTLFQSIDATSLSAKELRNTLLRCWETSDFVQHISVGGWKVLKKVRFISKEARRTQKPSSLPSHCTGNRVFDT